LNNAVLWEDYHSGKQTYVQLAKKYGCSVRTIQRRLDQVQVTNELPEPRSVVVLMDTTYFGRRFGVMVFKDALSGENLLKTYVKYETNQLYQAGINELTRRGYKIQAIVCDGRRGLLTQFSDVPVQMCQFHQVAIITRYLTRNPKTPASVQLREIVSKLTKTTRSKLELAINEWETRWHDFIHERTKDPETDKTRYTHKRLRSALRSLKTNLPWLFTFEDYPDQNIPNTTNAIDGQFANLKSKLRNHNGLSIDRRKKFIDEFLKA
jgi:hypothetical protein